MPVIEKLKQTKSPSVDWSKQAFWILLRFWPPAQEAKYGLALGHLRSIWVLHFMHTKSGRDEWYYLSIWSCVWNYKTYIVVDYYDYVYDLVIWEVWKVKSKTLFVFQPTGFAHVHPESNGITISSYLTFVLNPSIFLMYVLNPMELLSPLLHVAPK